MGIDIVTFRSLADLSSRMDTPKRSVMLGRQRLVYRGKGDRHYNRALAKAGLSDVTIQDILSEDGFAEKALKMMGFGDVESLDKSDFEGAQIVHDLNYPVPKELHGQFDFIFDGGTIEHVFNVPIALENMFKMLKTDGVFASTNGMNGWWAHGLYQFNPDIVWSFWKRAAGCEVMTCRAVPAIPKMPAVDLPDPALNGRRLRGLVDRLPESRVYLYYEVRKVEGAILSGPAQQSDYARRWTEAGNYSQEAAE